MTHREVAKSLVGAFGLESPPIALAFAHEPPEGVSDFDGVVPSACTFWRRAESGVFYAPAAAHFNCPIGAMTMGFDLDEVTGQLMGLVGMMTSIGYIAADEAGSIASMKVASSGSVYGPLAEFPIPPSAVLLWLSPQQAMLFAEASGRIQWTANEPMTIHGRPGCAALPVALNTQRATVSLGCTGMRTFTEVADDRLLGVIPGPMSEAFVTALTRTISQNQTMEAFYRTRKAAISG